MAEVILYCQEIGSVLCETCPLRQIPEEEWTEIVYAEPIAAGFYIKALREALRRRTILPRDATMEPELYAEFNDGSTLVDIVDEQSVLTDFGKQLEACFTRNYDRKCADTLRLPNIGMGAENGIGVLVHLLNAGTPEEIQPVAANIREQLLESTLEYSAGESEATDVIRFAQNVKELNDEELLEVALHTFKFVLGIEE